MSWQFEEIPKRVVAFLERVGITAQAGESIGAALARELKAQLGYVVPAGKKVVLSVTIRAELLDVEA